MDNNNIFTQSTEAANKLIETIGSVELMIHQRYLEDISKGILYNMVPLESESIQCADRIRLLRIFSMSYENSEDVAKRFTNIFTSIAQYNMTTVYILRFQKDEITFYMGISSDDKNEISTIYDTFQGAFMGNFPGGMCQTVDTPNNKILLEDIFSYPTDRNITITSVSGCINFEESQIQYIEGMERLVDGMIGEAYDLVILAKAIPDDEISRARDCYEKLYSQLTPFKQSVLTLSENNSLSYARSVGSAISDSLTQSTSHSIGTSSNYSYSKGKNKSKTERTPTSRAIDVGSAILSVAGTGLLFAGGAFGQGSTLASSMMGGVYMSAPIANAAKALVDDEPVTTTEIESETHGSGDHEDFSVSEALAKSITLNENNTSTVSTGGGKSIQYTYVNKAIDNLLKDIEVEISKLKYAESIGAFSCAAYFITADNATARRASNLYKSIVLGNGRTNNGLYTNLWNDADDTQCILNYLKHMQHPRVLSADLSSSVQTVSTGVLVPSNLMPMYFLMPVKSLTGLEVTRHAHFSRDSKPVHSGINSISIGNLFHMGIEYEKNQIHFDLDSLTMHCFVTGTTGSGKSNTVYSLLNKIVSARENLHFMVIEPVKGDYKTVFGHRDDVEVYGTNTNITKILKINPFRFNPSIHILEHIDSLVSIFNVCWPMEAAMPSVLKQSIERAYERTGWNLKKSTNKFSPLIFPSFKDVLESINQIMEESDYSAENKGNYKGALCTRVSDLMSGINSMIFVNDDLTDEELFEQNVIIDLSRLGSPEIKSLIMGLLVIRLKDYRQSTVDSIGSKLKHITVLEEAHNLLKQTSTDQSVGSANITGKSVEMLSNSLAEMRSSGEGFIIVDQAPGLLDLSVIRNTNTKIIMRLPESSDRVLTGNAVGLNDDQIEEISKLPTGVAVVYQNDWLGAALVKIPYYLVHEKMYCCPQEIVDKDDAQTLVTALAKGKFSKWAAPYELEGKEKIAKLELDGYTKSILYRYVSNNIGERTKLLPEIAYSIFNTDEVMKLIRNTTNIVSIKKIVRRKLKPSIQELNETETDYILFLLFSEAHNQSDFTESQYEAFGEYLRLSNGKERIHKMLNGG